MRSKGDQPERLFEVNGAIRPSRKFVRPAEPTQPLEAAVPAKVAERLSELAKDVERLQRLGRGPSVMFRVQVDGSGDATQSFRLRHNLGGSVVVFVAAPESSTSGTIACDPNYRVDLSDDETAEVTLSNASAIDYVATIRVEAV